ncbi:MAG: hypothetical protein JKY24_03655 [Pseudomonadales bacterium]|nr:hypothetical protein [Pseudomonadales bacterium]
MRIRFNKIHSAILSVSVAIVIVSGGSLYYTQHLGPESIVSEKFTSAQMNQQHVASSVDRQWIEGRQRRYSVLHDIVIRLGGNSEPVETIRIEGDLNLGTAYVDDDEVRIEVQFSTTSVEPISLVKNADHLSHPFMISLSLDGKIQSARFNHDTKLDSQAILRGLIGISQLTLRDTDQWSLLEMDATGEYLANYQRISANKIRRVCGGYEYLVNEDGLVSVDTLHEFKVDGYSDFSLDSKGHMVSMYSEQTLRFVPTQAMGELYSHRTTRLQLEWEGSAQFTLHWEDLGAGGVLAQAVQRDEDAQRSIDQQLAGDQDIQAIVGGARNLASLSENDARKGAGEIAIQLGAKIRIQPEVIFELEEILMDADVMPLETEAALLGGLTYANTNAAREALTRLLDADLSQARHMGVIGALNQQPHTSLATGEAMLEQLNHSDATIAKQALLALGSMAGQLQENESLDVVPALLDAWENANDSHEKEVLIDAVGNSGDLRGLPYIEEVLESEDSGLHPSALYALRSIESGRAAALLRENLGTNAPIQNQLAALAAVRYRSSPSTFRVDVESLLQTSDSTEVLNAANSLIDMMEKS